MISIKNKQDCCGCSACVQRCAKGCIALYEDSEGFLYPKVDLARCNNCGLCENVCPCINEVATEKASKESVYAAINQSDEERLKSSSGGVFVKLAEQIINDGGVVFGAGFDENWEVHHVSAETMDDVHKLMGSKYLQSRIENTYKEAEYALKKGRKVMFTGTSCQIKGLLGFLGRPYDNLLAVDVICHGVPSPSVWRSYVSELKDKAAHRAVDGKNTVLSLSLSELPSIEGISFRDKSLSGWKKFCFVVRSSASKADKNSVLLSAKHFENPFMRGFLSNVYLRPSCYDCKAKGGRSGADLTLADFWGVNQIVPDWDDDKGTSLVVLHTSRGGMIFENIDFKKVKIGYDLALRYNPSYYSSVVMPKEERRAFYRRFKKGEAVSSIVDTVLYVPEWKVILNKSLKKARRIARGVLRKLRIIE